MGFGNFAKLFGQGQQGVLHGASGPSNLPMPPNNPPVPMEGQAQAPGVGSGGNQPTGPWAAQASALAGNQMAAQNNMGMNQATPQAPMGMGGNPMQNMMNPYQGKPQGLLGGMGNPNQRNPFMGSIGALLGGRMGGGLMQGLGRYRR